MIATYHNHTDFSDGASSLEEMVAAAARLGVDELGISDHFVLPPPSRPQLSWAMRPERLGAYVEQVRAFAGSAAPVVRLGLEVDWFPGQAGAIRAALEDRGFDYLIGSVHEVDGFCVDGSAAAWAALDEAERDDRHRAYWREIRAMAASGLFDVAAHLDLPKKFGFTAGADLSGEISAALDAIAEAGLVVEINTAGWHKPCADAYPSVEIVEACRVRDIPMTISADAHHPDHLLRDFDRAAARLRDAGYERIARFSGREVRFEALA